MELAFVQFDPHDEKAGPGLVHGQDHPLVTHLLQVSVLHNFRGILKKIFRTIFSTASSAALRFHCADGC
jgi:hypothetical protein